MVRPRAPKDFRGDRGSSKGKRQEKTQYLSTYNININKLSINVNTMSAIVKVGIYKYAIIIKIYIRKDYIPKLSLNYSANKSYNLFLKYE